MSDSKLPTWLRERMEAEADDFGAGEALLNSDLPNIFGDVHFKKGFIACYRALLEAVPEWNEHLDIAEHEPTAEGMSSKNADTPTIDEKYRNWHNGGNEDIDLINSHFALQARIAELEAENARLREALGERK